MKILLTGAAGFIGMHIAEKLLLNNNVVIGIDNLNNYYNVNLKKARLQNLNNLSKKFKFLKLDIIDKQSIDNLFKNEQFDFVVNLAAQPGVRYSLENPYEYINSNIFGFLNILEGCKKNRVKHLVFASSSSVYGINTKMPFSENDNTDHPISLYGATKKSNEVIAHSYSHLYDLPITGLRFFTVYGPWGRPDMAPFIFTDKILNSKPIKIFNNGHMERDFTYIDDVINALNLIIFKPAMPKKSFDSNNPKTSSSSAPFRIFNIGNHKPVKLLDFVEAIEQATGKKAKKIMDKLQVGDVISTYSSNDKIEKWVGINFNTEIHIGIKKFVTWYKDFYEKNLN